MQSKFQATKSESTVTYGITGRPDYRPNFQNLPHPSINNETRKAFVESLYGMPMDELLKLARGDNARERDNS